MSKDRSNYTSKTLSESMHACLRADHPSGKGQGHVCQRMGCELVFSPKRKDQKFCRKECRQAYFSIARKVGIAILEMMFQDDVRSGENQPHPLLVSLKFPRLIIELVDPFGDKHLEGLKPEEKLSEDGS